MLDGHPSRNQRTVAADKTYDTEDVVADCRTRQVTPHLSMHITAYRHTVIDAQSPSRLRGEFSHP